jgi:hypothetical protein
MVVVVEVVVVVLRGARAHEEGEHEGEEENADGGGTRGTSGKHGVCECVRAQDGCVCRFSRKRCRRPAAGPIRNALKICAAKNSTPQICTVCGRFNDSRMIEIVCGGYFRNSSFLGGAVQ